MFSDEEYDKIRFLDENSFMLELKSLKYIGFGA